MDAPKDGYTWTAGAAKQLGTYPVLGMINSKVDDFHLFLAVTNVSIVSVNPSTPYQTLPQLLDAMKAKPDAGGDRGQQLVGPLRDGGDRQGHRREVPARHLRRRQPGRGVDRVAARPR